MCALSVRPGILDIVSYVGGESAIAGQDRVIKLSSNESAHGPSPKARAAVAAASAVMHRYPDVGSAALRAAIGAAHGLDPQRIVCGAGSDEILGFLAHAYAGPGDETLHTEHGFLMYTIFSRSAGATPIAVAETDLTANVDALLAAVTPRTRILFVANPNNPTGTYLSEAEITRLRDGLRDDILLVIDAAYAEFVTRADFTPGAALVDSGDNVVMARTFSKIYGLGGLRLGWAYCPPSIADVLNRLRGPFNISSIAQAAGVAALDDTEFLAMARAHNETWREWLRDRMTALGLETSDSVANFLLIRFPVDAAQNAESADLYLRGKGIIARRVDAYGLPNHLRITIGLESEMRAVAAALSEFMDPSRKDSK